MKTLHLHKVQVLICVCIAYLWSLNVFAVSEKQATDVVREYYRLLNIYSQSVLSSINTDMLIYELFKDDETPVYADLNYLIGQEASKNGNISNYLGMVGYLYNEKTMQLSFSISNISNTTIPAYTGMYSSKSFNRDDDYIVTCTKKITPSGANKCSTIKEQIVVEEGKIVSIMPDDRTHFASAMINYKNRNYSKAFELFEQDAQRGDRLCCYWTAIMLLEKKGCDYPKEVRLAMALYWLEKSCQMKYGNAWQLKRALAVDRVPRVTKSSPVNDGLISSINNQGKFGYIDLKGRTIISYKYTDAAPFSNGYAAVKDYASGKWGYINKRGRVVVDFKYDAAGDVDAFHEAQVVNNGQKYRINVQ